MLSKSQKIAITTSFESHIIGVGDQKHLQKSRFPLGYFKHKEITNISFPKIIETASWKRPMQACSRKYCCLHLAREQFWAGN